MRVDIRKHSDIILALFVVSVAAMLLVPLPTQLLDVLLVLNISFSLLLLLVGLYLPNALAMLSFPSLLLLTTLFRLSLNVASARLILSQGNAGEVIRAFGTFLVRGEVAVGIIIFTIITIVNFIVIARGASRVSEVAARFALDALPGKQIAIDADVRAGLISATQAQDRREDLGRESQLYGAMDGAMKFVQGDAIAGFFIILTNIIGGIYIGVSQGMNFSQAVETYTVLTVGDGLVTQVPALLISICAGIVVTRVSSREGATLGTDVGSQLFRRPATVILAGILLFGIALMPGLPKTPFILVSLLFLGLGFYLRREQRTEETVETRLLELGPAASTNLQRALPGPIPQESNGDSLLQISLDSVVLYRLYQLDSTRLQGWWHELRNNHFQEVGIKLPNLSVVADPRCSVSQYMIYSGGTLVDRGLVPLDSVLVEVNPSQAQVLGLEVVLEADHPFSGSKVFWARDSEALRAITSAAEIRTFSFFEYIGLKAAAFFSSYPEDLLSITDVHTELKAIEKRYPGLLDETIDRAFLNTARLTEILHELVREGISIRDMRQVIEAVASYCAAYAKSELEPSDFDLQEIVSYIRKHRRRQLVGRLLSDRRTLRVVTLSDGVESALAGAAQTGTAAIESEMSPVRNALELVMSPLLGRGIWPVVLLVKPELREQVYNALRGMRPQLPVVTFQELDGQTAVESVGVWHV